MAGRVEGKVAFVTGAARGQGRAHAVRLAEEGADIIAVDFCKNLPNVPYALATPEDLAETVDLVKNTGRRIFSAQVDVRDFKEMKKALDAGVEEFGKLDIVAANAGIGSSGGMMADMEEDVWQETIDINLSSVWLTAKAAIPHLQANGSGSIILTSSVGGLKAYPMMGHYVAAKHGVIGIMRALAVELGWQNIRVNSVHPTQVSTPMVMNEMTFKMFRPDLENPTADDFAPFSQQLHVLPTPWVDAVDIANAVLFLASDEARFITGVQLPIDAGALLK